MDTKRHIFCKVPADLYEQNLTKNQIKFYLLLCQRVDSQAIGKWKGYTLQHKDATLAEEIGSTPRQISKIRHHLQKLSWLEYEIDHAKKYKDNNSSSSYRYKLPSFDPFCQIPKDLFKQHLTGKQLQFYLFIAARYDNIKKNGWSIPQQDQQIVESINSTVGEVVKIRQKLIRMGLIETDRIALDKDNVSYRYRINWNLTDPIKQTITPKTISPPPIPTPNIPSPSTAHEQPVEAPPQQPSIITPTKAIEPTIAEPEPSQTEEERIKRLLEEVRKNMLDTLPPEEIAEMKKHGRDLTKPIS